MLLLRALVCPCPHESLCARACTRVFCSGLSEELRVEGCLFNVTFTSDAAIRLAVYFRAHDNDLRRQSVTLTLTLSG